MKLKIFKAGLMALAFAVVVAQFTPTVRAQSQKSQDPSAQQQPDQQQQQPDQQKSQTFLGQVVQAKNGQYALLVDKNAGKGFYLDDQEKAKRYSGQNVKVTGTLNAANSTIHVTDIQPAGS
jgi:hypothetical protein